MEENTETLMTTPSEVADNTPESEPIENDNTSEDTGLESNTEAVKEAEPLVLGKYKTIEEAEEGLRNRQSMLDKREAEEIKLRDEKIAQYEQIIKSQGYESPQQFQDVQMEKAVRAEYQNEISTINQNYDNIVSQLNNALENGEITEPLYQQYLAYYGDLKVEAVAQAKLNDIQRRYILEEQRQQQNKIMQKQEVENFLKENQEVFEKPYMKNILAECEKAGFIAQDYSIVKNLAEMLIKDYEAHKQNESNLNSENKQAIQRLQSAVNGGTSVDNSNRVFTRAEIRNMSNSEYEKHQDVIFEQMKKGLIK